MSPRFVVKPIRRIIKHLYRWRTGWKTPRQIRRPTEDKATRHLSVGEVDFEYEVPDVSGSGDARLWLAAAMVYNHTAESVADVQIMVDGTRTIDTRPPVEQLMELLDSKGRYEVWNSERQQYAPSTKPVAIAERLNEQSVVHFVVSPGQIVVAQMRIAGHVN